MCGEPISNPKQRSTLQTCPKASPKPNQPFSAIIWVFSCLLGNPNRSAIQAEPAANALVARCRWSCVFDKIACLKVLYLNGMWSCCRLSVGKYEYEWAQKFTTTHVGCCMLPCYAIKP